jgi:hypothetical protein
MADVGYLVHFTEFSAPLFRDDENDCVRRDASDMASVASVASERVLASDSITAITSSDPKLVLYRV